MQAHPHDVSCMELNVLAQSIQENGMFVFDDAGGK